MGGNSAWRSTADIVAGDVRLKSLPAVRSGDVYTLDAQRDGDGRFLYPELWLPRPDWYLADFFAAGHPQQRPRHAFAFMRRIGTP